MFLASKLLNFIYQPLAWVVFLVLLSSLLVHRRPIGSRRLGLSAAALLLLMGWTPLPDALLRTLESQYPPRVLPKGATGFHGVIVLGGALEPAYQWSVPGQSALTEAAERMTEVLPLLRNDPQLRLVFTGGSGELGTSELSEAQRAKIFFDAQGVAPHRVTYESRSRTTYENAVLTKQLKNIDAAQPWLLLTTASHMPRSMAVFRAAGWNVTAYPVDFRSGARSSWSGYAMDAGLKKWRQFLHEWLGLWVYKLTGQA